MAASKKVVVRRIAVDDGPLLRQVRLAAIADSPGVFTSTLEQAESHDAHHWESAAFANATGGTEATFFAEADGAVVGMLGAYTMTGGIVTLVGLWSGPGYRDVGVADALLDSLGEWATRSGARQLRLWVLERNEHARRFYEGRGFVATGQTMPYELDSSILEMEMTCDLPAEE